MIDLKSSKCGPLFHCDKFKFKVSETVFTSKLCVSLFIIFLYKQFVLSYKNQPVTRRLLYQSRYKKNTWMYDVV